jgi:hypothetical protein
VVLTSKFLSGFFLEKVFDMDFLQKYFYCVFELPVPRNARKRTKKNAKKKKSAGGWVGLGFWRPLVKEKEKKAQRPQSDALRAVLVISVGGGVCSCRSFYIYKHHICHSALAFAYAHDDRIWTKDPFLDTKNKSSETLILFLSDVFFRRLKRISYELNQNFGGVMGSGVRHFGLYAVFGAKYQ